MRPEMEQILDGKFEYEAASLEFSTPRIEIELSQNQAYEGTFRIISNAKKQVYGSIFSSDIRMKCLVQEFTGNDEEIPFQFDSYGMAEGDALKGEIFVVSSAGEYYLPYVVSIIHAVLDSSMGPIRNLFHFANLAKASWDEAIELFYSEDFVSILEGNDRRFLESYFALSRYKGNEQNMEEFLLEINKKQIVEYEPSEKIVHFENIEQTESHLINITKNGWGYTFLKVEIDGAFLSLENSVLTEEHFMGNFCRCQYYIHPEYLHAGNNYGKIRFYNSFTEFTLAVQVAQKPAVATSQRERKEKEHNQVAMMEYYQAFRTKKISSATWLKETGRIIDKMLMNDETDIAARLYQAQLLITENRQNEAKWVLDRVETMIVKKERMPKEQAIMAYYLYLTSLNSREETYVDKITATVMDMHDKNPGEWRIAWLLLFLSEEIGKTASSKWLFLEQEFYKGAISPLFYIEAFLILNASPGMLTKLDEFEIQILNYAAKRKLLEKDLIRQLLYLLERNNGFEQILYRILECAYEVMPTDEVLNAICTMLIKGNKVEKEYFKWYEKGVASNLRITRLYEFYMYSIDKTQEKMLPKIIVMYFNYNSALDYETNAYLYANVYRHHEKYVELYESYRPQIERFLQEQIEKDHINRDLAYLYKNILSERMLNETVAGHLAPMLFANLVKVETPGIRSVIVKPDRGNKEYIYPVIKGSAVVVLYTGEYTLSFEDEYRNRYMHSVSYTIEKMLLPTKLAKMVAPLVHNCSGLDAYLCDISKEINTITEENLDRYLNLLQSDSIKPEYVRQIEVYLLQFYYENDKIDEMDQLLSQIDTANLTLSEKNDVVKLLGLRGMNTEAYSLVCTYGIAGIDIRTLFRIVSRQIMENDFAFDEFLLAIAHQCFKKGKYDVNILKYLVQYYQGMAKELRDIWQAAEAFDVDSLQLCERLLEQVMYTGAYIGDILEVFDSYNKKTPDLDIVHAFLIMWAADFFIKDKVVPAYIFEQIIVLYEKRIELLDVEKLAVIKFYADHKEKQDAKNCAVCRELIEELMVKDIFLPFFLEFIDGMPQLEMMADKTFIEYKGHPNGKATMHYVIEYGEEEPGEYCTEEMHNVFGGNYCKEFILFYGESLKYYIMEEVEGKEQLTESKSVHKSDIARSRNESKFDLINDISISRTLQDYETVDELLNEYHKTEYIIERLFGDEYAF